MTETGKRANNATISDLGIKNATTHWNLSPEELANIYAIKKVYRNIDSLIEKNKYTYTTAL